MDAPKRKKTPVDPGPGGGPEWRVPALPASHMQGRSQLGRLLPALLCALAMGTFLLPFTQDLFVRTGHFANNMGLRLLELDRDNRLLYTFGAALLGCLSWFVRRHAGYLIPIVAGPAGIAALFWYRSGVERHVDFFGRGEITVNYQAGFWLALALLGAASLLSLGLLFFDGPLRQRYTRRSRQRAQAALDLMKDQP